MTTTQSIIRLTPRHMKILDYCIEGLTSKVIAEKLNMAPRQVGIIINSGSFQHQLSIRRSSFSEDIDNKLAESEISTANMLKEASAKAAARLILGVDSQNESNALRSADSILDRSGHCKQVRQVDSDNKPIINISREDLQLLNETLRLERDLMNGPPDTKEIISTQTATITEGGDL